MHDLGLAGRGAPDRGVAGRAAAAALAAAGAEARIRLLDVEHAVTRGGQQAVVAADAHAAAVAARATRAVDELGALDQPWVLELGDLGGQDRAV